MVQWIQDKWKRVRVNRGLNHKGSVKIDIVQSQAGKGDIIMDYGIERTMYVFIIIFKQSYFCNINRC